MVRFFLCSFLGASILTLTACEQIDFPKLTGSVVAPPNAIISDKAPEEMHPILGLEKLIEGSHAKVDLDLGFASAMLQALDQDPSVLAAKNEALASKQELLAVESGGDTQINAKVLGGIEDITDETVGVAAILTANRMLYDGGILDAKIDAAKFYVKAAHQLYLAKRGERSLKLAAAWIDLERYESLQELIESRLAVLDPLLQQLARVTEAGVGDVSQVASAQRIVSAILVAETDVSERYQQAKVSFTNGFGDLPAKARYDASWVSGALPNSTDRNIVENAPALLAKYWAYRSAEASVVAVESQKDFVFGLQARLQLPLGGSDADSDESVGFTVTKNFYRGNQLEAQIKRAESRADSKAAEVVSVYREGELSLLSSRELIKSLRKAIKLAQSNAERSREEIDYLRKQLIIGGSTLESVLTAEARLYDAESKEISFIAQQRKAEATIVALTGAFSRALSSN